MSNYNLSDNVNDSFDFVLRDLKFSMRYPQTAELEDVQTLSKELQDAQDADVKDEAKIKEITEKLEGVLYSFISPVEHDTDIRTALRKENIRVMRNFNAMIRTELAV